MKIFLEVLCKSKWKSLRDNFRREYKKLLKLKVSNKSATSSWIHFNDLKFLENVLASKNVSGSNCIQRDNDDDDIETIVIEPSDVDDDEDDNYSYIRQQQQEQQRLWLSRQQNFTRCCPHNPGDEFINFFKSITPYLALMNPSAKLRVRIAIQEIILNELSMKIDATRKRICDDNSTPKKRVSNRVVKRNRKYI